MIWNVGPEYDNLLFNKLGATLRELGFDLTKEWSGIAGSQEVTHWEVSSLEGTLTIDSETYIGLTVEGSKELVEKVRDEFSQK